MNYLLSALSMSKNVEQEDDKSEQRDPYGSLESLPLPVPAVALKMQVILRTRPASPAVKNKNQADVYAVENPTTLLVRNSNSNDSGRRFKSDENPMFKKYKFNHIFNLQIDQSLFFKQAVMPSLVDFLNNVSSIVISYGSTNAGKTYTLFGTTHSPGIIPRSIEYIFSSINCTLSPWYKPEYCHCIVDLDECRRAAEVEVKNQILCCRSIDKDACEKAYAAVQDSEANDHCDVTQDSMFSLWISFIEIYNDAVFDLLEVDEEGKNMSLKLSTDKHGSTYVQGMRSVCATTGLEAYQILNAGQMRLSTVSVSNYKSSRSHAIFTMRLLKYQTDSAPSEVQMSTISFYDLAGPGKMQHSTSNDKQQKESRSINTSLLAFGRCLKALAEGHSRQSIGPFRDSKLTRLFQHSLRKENVIILIHLNPTFELFAETQNVLNFASTAIKLTSEFAKEDKRLLDYQSLVSSPKLQQTRSSTSTTIKTLHDQEINEVKARNKQLLDQIKHLKSTESNREYKLRQDLSDFYAKQLNELEEIWKNRMSVAEQEKEYFVKFSVDTVDTYYKCKLNEHLNRKRRRVDSEALENIRDTNVVNVDNLKVKKLEKVIKTLKEKSERLSLQNNQYSLEISWINDHLKRITDFIESSHENCSKELIIDDFPTKNFENVNNLTISHLLNIITVVKQSFITKPTINDFYETRLSTKEVQCKLDLSCLDAYCQQIEILFRSSDVSLPQIDDTLDMSNEVVDRKKNYSKRASVEIVMDRLSRIKESIVEHISRQNDLETENHEKDKELILLKRKIEQQDMEILQMRQQYEESESTRLLLLKKCESFEVACKSREFFKNSDFDAVRSENSLSGALRHEVINLDQPSSDDSFQISLLDSTLDKSGINETRFSSDSSKNDSGVAFSMESVVSKFTDEKDCQTDFQCDKDQTQVLNDKLMQLNVDYSRMEAQHLQGSTRITELSLELERIEKAMSNLKENTYLKDQTINQCQSKLDQNEREIEHLTVEKKQLEIKFNELQNNLAKVSRDYEEKLGESQVKLRVHEVGESRASRCLKDYWEKSVSLGSKLSIAYSELEKFSVRCYKEHILKIHKLEEELNEKKISLTNLNEQMSAYKRDLTETIVLSKKVDDLENTLNQIEKDKVEVEKVISDKSKAQLLIQKQLHNLTEMIGERDNQIISLEWQLATITKANLSNSRKAKELGKDVTKLIEKIGIMKEEISHSETARTDLERKSTREIDNLRARLIIFEENADLLNLIRNTRESKECEVDKLKLKVLEKEKELEFFKKNRNATIQRYESLVQQLQQALNLNNYPNRMKRASPHKTTYCSNDLAETTSCRIYSSNLHVHDWKADDKDVKIRGSRENPSLLLLSVEKNHLEARDEMNSIVDFFDKDLDTRRKSFESSFDESCREIGNCFDIEEDAAARLVLETSENSLIDESFC